MVEEIKLLNDKACKRMLSHKKALAIINKTFIPEFKDIDLAIIEKCIIGSKEKDDKIESLKSKDDLIKDNLVYYD